MAIHGDARVDDLVAFGRWLVDVKGGRLQPIEDSASIHYRCDGVPVVVIAPDAFERAVAGYQAIRPRAPVEVIWEDIWINLTDSWESTPRADSLELTPDGRTFLPPDFESPRPSPWPMSVLTVRQTSERLRDSAENGSWSPSRESD